MRKWRENVPEERLDEPTDQITTIRRALRHAHTLQQQHQHSTNSTRSSSSGHCTTHPHRSARPLVEGVRTYSTYSCTAASSVPFTTLFVSCMVYTCGTNIIMPSPFCLCATSRAGYVCMRSYRQQIRVLNKLI